METTVCAFCGQNDPQPFLDLQDWMFERPEVTCKLVRCRNCGFVYQNPRPTPQEMGAHYPSEYDCYAAPPDPSKTSTLSRLAYNYGLRKRTRAVTHHKKTGTLLDVGCASGHFLEAMAAVPGWTVHGVEINPQAADLARQRGLQVFTGTVEEAPYPPGSFDAVTLWDVLEHVHDPNETLAAIYRLLKPGGLILMRVPNLDSWDAKIFGPYWAGYEPPRHTYVFDRAHLREIVSRTGFNQIRMSCNIGSYPTFMLSVQFWLTGREMPRAQRERILRFLGSPLMRLATAPLFYLANAGLRGPLVILTGRKRSHSEQSHG